jgi:peptidoglycan/LPS O-acetylase OafA/YrhL
MKQSEVPSKVTGIAARVQAALGRVTTSGLYVPEVDGLRFVAIMMVVAYHISGYWTSRAGRTYPHLGALDTALQAALHLGFYGVHLFFVISGFVLAMPFCKHALAGGKPVDLGKYFLRRLTRLEPPYVISMLLFFVTMPLFGKSTWSELAPHLLASLAYVHNIVYGCGSLINNNAWSLEIEVQFYLVVPLIAAALWLPAIPRRALCIAAIVGFSLHERWLPESFPLTILQFAQYFLTGILLCDLWTSYWRQGRPTRLGDVPGLMAIVGFSGMNIAFPGLISDLANPWLMAAFFYSAIRGKAHSGTLTWGWIPIIGGMCYSIYLIHARVIAIVIHGALARLPLLGSFAADYAVVFAIAVPIVLFVSTMFFLAIEKPFMRPDWPSALIAALFRNRQPLPASAVGQTRS